MNFGRNFQNKREISSFKDKLSRPETTSLEMQNFEIEKTKFRVLNP